MATANHANEKLSDEMLAPVRGLLENGQKSGVLQSSEILAVLEKRMGYFYGNLDVYVNIIGGLRVNEPAADLPVAMALYSSLFDKPIDEDTIAFGETDSHFIYQCADKLLSVGLRISCLLC